MNIRKATMLDVEQLAVLVSLFTESSTTGKQIENRLRAMQATEQVIIAEIDNIIVGFGSLRLIFNFSDDNLYAELADLFVHPNFRRKKVAQNIMLFIEKICKEKQIGQLVLITRSDNIEAQSFYKSIGFTDWALALKKIFY